MVTSGQAIRPGFAGFYTGRTAIDSLSITVVRFVVVDAQDGILVLERAIRIAKLREQTAADAVLAPVEIFRFNEQGARAKILDDKLRDRSLNRSARIRVSELSRMTGTERIPSDRRQVGLRPRRETRRHRRRVAVQSQFPFGDGGDRSIHEIPFDRRVLRLFRPARQKVLYIRVFRANDDAVDLVRRRPAGQLPDLICRQRAREHGKVI